MFGFVLNIVSSFFKKHRILFFVILFFGSVSASFYGGWKVHDYKIGYELSEQLKAEARYQKELDDALYQISRKITEEISDIRIEQRNIYNETKTEILRERIYEECKVPKEGVELLQRSRGSNNAN